MAKRHACWRVVLVLAIVLSAAARPASAAPITVGEFTWEYSLDPTPGCTLEDPTCVFSTFGLTYLWDGPDPAPIVSSTVSLPDQTFTFFDLDPTLPFDQFGVLGLPAFATINASLFYNDELVTLVATLAPPSGGFGSAVLELPSAPAPVPEPGTLTLLGLGLAGLARHARRRAPRS